MKKILIIVTLLLTINSLSAQDKIVFDYDAAGNQILRELVFSRPSAIDEVDKINASVYPNPTSGMFNVKLDNNLLDDAESIKILDLSGKVLRETKVGNNSSYQIDIKDYPSGIYLVSVLLSNGKSLTKKVVKE